MASTFTSLSFLKFIFIHFYLFGEFPASTHRHHIHRLCLPGNAAVKICTIVNFGLPTAESGHLSWGQLLVNPYISPKLIFMTLSPSMYPISMLQLESRGGTGQDICGPNRYRVIQAEARH